MDAMDIFGEIFTAEPIPMPVDHLPDTVEHIPDSCEHIPATAELVSFPAEHIYETAMNTIITPEEEFINILDAADEIDELARSLETGHDFIDMITPMLATPFSPVPYDNFEIIDSEFQNMREQVVEISDPASNSTMSPLKQLLLSKSQMADQISHAKQPKRPISAPNKPNTRQSSARNSRTLKNSSDNLKRQTKASRKYYAKEFDAHFEPQSEVDDVPSTGNKTKAKVVSKALKFPPCSVCGGKASGLHYGVNSCEACKGFFRRFIIRNEEYKCAKDGNCKVVNRNRENCSGCRLKKCLALGMSKENSKLGRYSLSRRTETIKKVNSLEGKDKKHEKQKKCKVNLDSFKFDHTYSESESGKSSPSLQDIVPEDCSPDSLIQELMRAMDEIQPYGPNITTAEQVKSAIKCHHQRYQTKLQTYGEMKAVPKEEYYKLLKEYGIDVDGRIQVFKEYVLKIKRVTDSYCNFARQIPGFKKLQSRDQSNLLNAFRCDFFIILMHEGYSGEYGVILARNGVAYHINELADKFFSRKLITSVCDAYARFQRLSLSKEEKCLLMALTLTFTDRCNLGDPDFVDRIQYLVSEVIRYQLERTFGSEAQRRFAKFIECLVYLREVSEQYTKEFRQLCKDEMMIKEVPMMTEFVIDEW